jgi:hypothetical protein
MRERDGLQWPHRDGLKWPPLAVGFVVVGVIADRGAALPFGSGAVGGASGR